MSVPTTTALAAQIVAKLEAALSQTIPFFQKAFLRVLAKVLAAPMVLLYKYDGFLLLQQYATTATMRETEINGQVVRPLVELGRQFGVRDPSDAVQTEIVISVTVLEQTGSLASGQQLVRHPTNVVYAVTAAVPLDAATVQATIKAVSDESGGGGAGEIGILAPGDVVEFANAPPNVEPEATVVSIAVYGEDAEEQEDYRKVVLQRTQFRPQGGAPADYREWGEIVPGVKAIFPYKSEPAPGGVDIYVEAITAVNADGVPSRELCDAVEAAIRLDEDGLANNGPANDLVRAMPISRTPFTVIVSGLAAGGREDEVQAEIDAGLDEFLRSCEPYIVGLSMLPRRDRITLGAVSGVVHEIASAAGATVTSVALLREADEYIAYQLTRGELAKLAS